MFSEQGKTFLLARAEVKTETEEQQKLKNKNDARTEQPMLSARDSDACVCAMHMHHEEETQAPLMRVTSEVRLDQAKWSSSARTLRESMRKISEVLLWNKLAFHARAWNRFLRCLYLDSTGAAE